VATSPEVADAVVGAAAPPASARLLRDFVNTFEPQTNRELLTSSSAACRWLIDHGLLDDDADLDDADLDDADLDDADLAALLEVRESLRELLRAHTGEDLDRAVLQRLDDVLARTPMRVVFDGSARPALVAVSQRPSSSAVAGLLDAVYGCVAEGTWDRLKVCARHACRWAFYDASRNRSGRWCSMEGCGNQVKMRRAYAARKERAAKPA
jgi:predicted RNA-binding Zn ribbon-like protein